MGAGDARRRGLNPRGGAHAICPETQRFGRFCRAQTGGKQGAPRGPNHGPLPRRLPDNSNPPPLLPRVSCDNHPQRALHHTPCLTCFVFFSPRLTRVSPASARAGLVLSFFSTTTTAPRARPLSAPDTLYHHSQALLQTSGHALAPHPTTLLTISRFLSCERHPTCAQTVIKRRGRHAPLRTRRPTPRPII